MKLKFITSNDHKFLEMRSKLSNLDIKLEHIKQSYPEIQADSITEIARYSLSLMTTVTNGNFIIEDAGIEVDALKLFPGPYSSYIFQTIGYEGILKLMKGESNRNARFKSVIGLMLDDEIKFFEGICEGTISDIARGNQGFGFDPIFIPKGFDKTFAELDISEKNKISHRSISSEKLIDFLSQ